MLFVARTCLTSAEIQIQQSGLNAANSDVRVLRRRFDETLARISMLEQSAIPVAHAYDAHAADFLTQLEGLRNSLGVAGPEFMQITSLDAEGFVQWSTVNDAPEHISFADRPYFRKLSSEGSDLFVDVPVIGRLSHKPAMPFAFARRDIAGKFKGAIIVRLDRDFAEFLQEHMPDSRRSVVALIRRDGQVLSRSVRTDAGGGGIEPTKLPVISTGRVIDAGSSGFVVSPVDGIRRFVATAYNGQWNTILLVGLEPQPELEQFSATRRRIVLATVLATLGCLVIILAVTLLVRRQQTISRMRASGRDLARREGVLTQIAQNATDMIVMMDGEFRYLYANPACGQMLGVDPATCIGQQMDSIIGPSAMLSTAMATLRRDGGALRLLCEATHIDGTPHWLDLELVSLEIEVDDFVSPCRYFGIARDVTARVVAERELVASNRRIENIMRVGPGFFYELRYNRDRTFHIEMPVDPGERLLGYTVEEAIAGGMLMQQTHPDDVPARNEAAQRCIQTGWSSVEFRVTAKNGATHWMLRQMQLSRQDDTGADLIAFVTDVTDEHDMRTRLRHSEQLASLGQLSANMAHELNQPLAALQLMIENTLSSVKAGTATPGRLIDKLGKIIGQVERLSQLINRMRQFSRDDRGTASVFSVLEVIDEAISLAETRIHRAKVSITRQLAPDLPLLSTDRLLLEQVLMNLIGNACDAYGDDQSTAPSEGRSVIISAEVSGRGMIVRVADRAGGIAPQVLPRLFEAFVTTKSAYDGTGLGLFVSAANIGKLGGHLTAHNADGGAVFEITLPTQMFA
ncbi:MAG: PAS domain S-box protein [Acetobacteraceae bacterium]|nr:PAS domain S-box protein [Acetobacteraceae bacterium]